MNDAAKDAFFDAIELPAGERRLMLEQRLAGDDAALREALRLLASHEAADEFMASPTILPSESIPTPEPDRQGMRVGPYTIESRIGQGGFGSVYLASQSVPVQRRVALKVLRSDLAHSIDDADASAEWQVLARMEHPYIPKVYDVGRTPDGLPYFAMEYIPGRPITEHVEGLPLAARLELMHKVCLGVQHLHQKGVIHRDIKPSNVLVIDIDGMPEPRIIDCGIAKLVESEGHTLPTASGSLVGTPAAMSPEQLTSPASVDTRSDVYALGVLLYQVLTGDLPFDRDKLRGTSLAGIARIICEDEPIRPSARLREPGSTTRVHFRQELDWVVLRSLEKSPERRYDSASDLAAELRRYLDNEPLEAGPPTLGYRASKFVGRHRAVTAAIGVAAAALVAIAITSLAFAVRTESQNQRIASELERSEQLLEFATGLLRGIDPAVARGQDRELVLQLLNDAIRRLEADPPDSDQVAYEVRLLLGDGLSKLGEFDTAREHFEQAEQAAVRAYGAGSAQQYTALSNIGRCLMQASKFDEARSVLARAEAGLAATLGEDHELTLRMGFSLAAHTRLTGSASDALAAFEALLPRHIAALGDQHEETMSVRNSIGVILGDLGETDRASELLRTVIDYQRQELGEDHPNLLRTMNNLAGIYRRENRNEDAIELMQDVLEIKYRVLGDDHPSTIVSLNNLGSLYERVDRHTEAAEVLTAALDTSLAHFGPDDRRSLILASNLAGNATARGQHAEALRLVEDAIPRSDATLGPMHPLGVTLRVTQIEATRALGEHDASIELARAFLSHLENGTDAKPVDVISARAELGRSLAAAGHWAEAYEQLVAAYGHGTQVHGDAEDSLRAIATELVAVCEAMGKADEARRWKTIAETAVTPE